ncbi:MAG: AGE family epimerase/isomerase, partial [Verrucomicrobiota bacterium]
ADYREALLNDTLPFWLPRGIDEEYGGYLLCRDRDGTLVDDDKAVWHQGRFAWLLATLYNTLEPREEWLQASLSGLEFLRKYGYDREGDGRMFFHLSRDGRPLRKRRYFFSECFASLAFSAYARGAGNDRAATEACDLFLQCVDYYEHPEKLPAKTTGVRPAKAIGVPMILLNVAQQLRENLAWDPADRWIDRFIEEIEADFVKTDLQCVMEQVAPDGSIIDHFDGRTLNPGHAIECAWFILHEARHRKDDSLTGLGCRMLDWMWARGWDKEYGGLLYFTDVSGKPVQEYWHDMKFWWPHNEAEIASLLAFLLTGESDYARKHEEVRTYSLKTFHDPEYGEWFGYVHRDGRVSSTLKGNLWKGPFHMPRMQWYCWQLLDQTIRGDARV